MARALVVGAGIFGVCAARTLRARGWEVRVLDRGPLPHPEASTTDLSKIVRMDYGDDSLYIDAMERAFPRWRAWNAAWDRPLFHETGFALLTLTPMAPGAFETLSYDTLRARGAALTRLSTETLPDHLPAFGSGRFTDGYLNPEAGWAESGEVLTRLIASARRDGVQFVVGPTIDTIDGTTVYTSAGPLDADRVVIAAGAWSARLLPELAPFVRTVGQPVIHLRPTDLSPEVAPPIPWAADISRTGWYGLPPTRDGIVKIAHHGAGRVLSDGLPVPVSPDELSAARAFLARYLPRLEHAPLAGTRRCLYADSLDGDFWISEVPDRLGVVVATGGSGHGFKFAPVLGDWIADVVEGRPGPERFAWRTPAGWHPEHARSHGALVSDSDGT